MPKNKNVKVNALSLDLKNFRTVPQPNEEQAINALIGIEPEWFWALMESLLEDGYHSTENIIVLAEDKRMIVKEGNRRIAHPRRRDCTEALGHSAHRSDTRMLLTSSERL